MRKENNVNKTTEIRQSAGFIDKLAYLLPTSKLLGPEITWLGAFREYVRAALAAGLCAPFFGSLRGFRASTQLVLPSGATAVVSYGRNGRKPQRFGIRVECNPAGLLDADVTAIHRFFIGAFGDKYLEMLKAPRVKRLDIAVDIRGLTLDDVFVTYAHAQHVTVFGKKFTKARGNVETWMFGSVTSSSAGAVYSKAVEDLHQLLTNIAKSGVIAERLSDNVVSQYQSMMSACPIVRVEVRLRKLASSVPELIQLENRLLRFAFIEYESTSFLSKRVRLAFKCMCRDIGLKAALEAFKGHPEHQRLTGLSRSRPRWWRPEKAWLEAVSHPTLNNLLTPPPERRPGVANRGARDRRAH